ncbi:MAG: hypothetical protein PHV32_09530 [Eubacteriales bacterium]|nr:hypothetical protein [Eubacteriales bacterium]
MKRMKKLYSLILTAVILAVIFLPSIPASASTYTLATDTSPAYYRNLPGVIICQNGVIPSNIRSLMAGGGHTFQFAPGEYLIQGSENWITVGSNTTIKGMVPIEQPDDPREIIYPDPSTQAVFATRVYNLSETQICTAEQRGYIQTPNDGTTRSNITFEDIFLSGYACMKFSKVNDVHINNTVIHNYRGTWPNGQYCNIGYGTATGSLWFYGPCNNLYINNSNFQMSFHHSFAIHTGNHDVWTKYVYLDNCRSLHAGAGVLNGQTDSDRATAALRVPETGGIGYYDWSVGFDICEGNSVDTVELTNCYAWDAWKVGFYSEPYSKDPAAGGNQKNVKLINCRSDDAGQRSLLVGSNPLVTKVKETEACNFYFQGGYFENCVSYNGLKSGYLFGPERDMGCNPVLPGRLRIVNCVDRASAIGMVIEMNGSRDVYVNGFKSFEAEKYAMRLFGSGNFQFSNIDVQVTDASHPPIQIGHLLRQQLIMSRDPTNICRTQMPPNPTHISVDDGGSYSHTDYGNYICSLANSSLSGRVRNYPTGNIVTVYSNTRGTSSWNGTTDPATIAASVAREEVLLDPEIYCPTYPSGDPGIPSAPTGLNGVMPTSSANNDGQITGTTTAMEWKAAADSTYTACTGEQITGLVPGSYHVRYKAVGDTPAGYNATVTVPEFADASDFDIASASSVKKPEWLQAGHNLGAGNTGDVRIEYYVTPTQNNIDGSASYLDSSVNLQDTIFANFAMMVRFTTMGYIDVRNGAIFDKTNTINYSANIECYVEIEADMDLEKYSVWVTPAGGSRTQIASNFDFRDTAPTTNDVGKVYFISEAANGLLTYRNHKVRPARLQTPAAPQGLSGIAPTTPSNNNGKITGTTAAMEWKPASGGNYTACSGSEITGLASGDYLVRYKASGEVPAGLDALVNVPKQYRNGPEGLTGVAPTTSANNNGKIVGTTTEMEYKLLNAPIEAYTACSANETVGLAANTYSVRYKENAVYYASFETEVAVPKQNRSAPTGLTGVAPSVYGGSNGKITGTTTEMEYKLTTQTDDFYASCSATETTGLSAGNYNVRYKENAAYFTSPAVTVTVPEGVVQNIWYSHKEADFTQYPILLGTQNTGTRVVEFDVTPKQNNMDGSVSYADSSTNVTGFNGLAMLVRVTTSGYFDVRNGSIFAKDATVNYTANNTYHVEIFANMVSKTYSVYITTPAGVRTRIANNYAFRSDAPATDDIGKVFVISSADNLLEVQDHKVVAAYYSEAYPSCFEQDDGIDLGSSNSGTAVTIEYDFAALASNIDGSVAFADSSAMVDYFTDLAMLIRTNTQGYFDVRNGAVFAKTNTVNYSAGQRFHFRIVANTVAKTYSVWVTPYGGSEVQIASSYAFRSDAPVTDDIGQLFFPSEPNSGLFVIYNVEVQ